ncbi:glycosyltransferase family 2 protein [Paenibacillus aceti]|uniref:glycosyltransferase family 2 protein n=1 Tax=Paenibacillus aceti TaxID=1820010 RepID=UPI001F09D436|nr:glycosyltransferase [Paenibacillus aceti]
MIRRRKRGLVPSTRKSAPRRRLPKIVNHPNPLVSIIIPAMNERTRLPAVLREAGRVHPCSETIVVANGSTDSTAEIAAAIGAKVLRYAEPLGHDVGRRIGAEAARGEVLLFIDADMIIPAARLRPFVNAVLSGMDVALNGYSGPVNRTDAHPVVIAKHTLNAWLARPDLQGGSLTAVPHALSRRAVLAIGSKSLEVPPLAHTVAIVKGLDVRIADMVDVGRMNPVRKPFGGQDPLTSLVVGDHLEAIHWLIQERGQRGGYRDLGRLRSKVR